MEKLDSWVVPRDELAVVEVRRDVKAVLSFRGSSVAPVLATEADFRRKQFAPRWLDAVGQPPVMGAPGPGPIARTTVRSAALGMCI